LDRLTSSQFNDNCLANAALEISLNGVVEPNVKVPWLDEIIIILYQWSFSIHSTSRTLTLFIGLALAK
jgi:hypothetical protein